LLSERAKVKLAEVSLEAFMLLVKTCFVGGKSNPSERAFMSHRKVFLCANESAPKYVTLYIL